MSPRPPYKRTTDLSFLDRMDGLGTTEDDIDEMEPAESVWPALGPDLDRHIALMRASALTLGVLLVGSTLIAFGVFLGWVFWG